MSWIGAYGHSHAPTIMSALNQQGMPTYNAAQAQQTQYNLGQQAMANSAQAQSQAALQYNRAQQMAQSAWNAHVQSGNRLKRFMIDGQLMDLDEFLDALYPDDCAEKTYLALKLTKGNEDDNT